MRGPVVRALRFKHSLEPVLSQFGHGSKAVSGRFHVLLCLGGRNFTPFELFPLYHLPFSSFSGAARGGVVDPPPGGLKPRARGGYSSRAGQKPNGFQGLGQCPGAVEPHEKVLWIVRLSCHRPIGAVLVGGTSFHLLWGIFKEVGNDLHTFKPQVGAG